MRPFENGGNADEMPVSGFTSVKNVRRCYPRSTEIVASFAPLVTSLVHRSKKMVPMLVAPKFTAMKYLPFSLTVLLCFMANSLLATNYSPASVSFYETPLVCGAAPDIGCGSRAKPMLLDLMENSRVREAWLNRTGTVVAVVWKEGFSNDKKRSSIFRKYAKQYDMDFVQ
jgi:hypothetical protein